MPTTYAHDVFGKEVYKRLPSDLKALIRRHGDLYRIGLHGPDILFYYMVSKNPVTQFGIEMHHEKARAFFEEGMRQVRRNEDEALFAYLLGFGCHYILDSACHPYVNKMAAEGVIPEDRDSVAGKAWAAACMVAHHAGDHRRVAGGAGVFATGEIHRLCGDDRCAGGVCFGDARHRAGRLAHRSGDER